MRAETTIENIRFARKSIQEKQGPLSVEDKERLQILDRAESEAEDRLLKEKLLFC